MNTPASDFDPDALLILAEANPPPTPKPRPIKGNPRLGHWLTDDPKVFEAFERQPQNKRPHVSLITTSADVEDAACMGLDGVRFARLYMDPLNPLTNEVIRALSPHEKSCPFNNLHPSALPPGIPTPDLEDLTAAALLKLAEACALPTKANDEAAKHTAEVQKKITLLQGSLALQYDFTKDPDKRPMLLNYSDPKEGINAPINPFLPQGKVGMFVAPGGTGKTQALSQLAVAVATGRPWLGCFQVASIANKHPSNGRVLLALGEEDRDEISRRINPYIQHCIETAFDKSEFQRLLTSNLKPLALDGIGPRMIGAKADDYNPEPFFDALHKVLGQDGKPWRLIILDPGSRFMGPDCETDNNAATRFIELIEQLTRLPGNPTVLLAHHTRKGTGKGNGGKDAARGASALTDGARWVAQLTQLTDDDENPTGTIELTINKSNYTIPPSKPICLRFSPEGNWLERVEAPTVETTKAKPKALAEEVKRLNKAIEEIRAEIAGIKKTSPKKPSDPTPNYDPKV